MNITVKTPSMPKVMTDWLRPESLLGRDFFDFGSDFFTPRLGITVPSVNIRETPKDYLFEVAAPGLERKDFNVELDNHMLKISVEKEDTKEDKENGYFRKEYSFTSFARSFTLPENVKESNIDAKYENGILTVLVPKAKEVTATPIKKITVG
jgi:HSP20 family protein